MNKQTVLRRIAELGLVPVVRTSSADDALRAIDAIREGGIDVLEITMTVPGAIAVMEAVVNRFGEDVIVGAGTVLDAETARACMLAGARFVVSPSLDLATLAICRRYSVAVMPGALTPTEVVTAWTAGADLVKVFPCGALGGASYLKSLTGPLPHIDFVPTGGVSLKTAADFIRAGAFAIGVGRDLVDVGEVSRGSLALVTSRARDLVRIVQDARAGA